MNRGEKGCKQRAIVITKRFIGNNTFSGVGTLMRTVKAYVGIYDSIVECRREFSSL